MSRITEALARTHGKSHSAGDGSDGVPWDFTTEGGSSDPDRAVVAEASPLAAMPVLRFGGSGSGEAEKLIGSKQVPPAVVEQYRRLGAALHQAQCESGVRVVMIASAMPEEGKTLLASNLGLVLSNSYRRRVLLIDGDLRQPTLHSMFGVPNTAGIADSLDEGGNGAVVPVQISPKLSLIVGGRPLSDPLRILTGPAMHKLITRASADFDWVILDTPPVALLPDASLLASMADRVVLVIHTAKTPFDLVQKSIDAIGADRILGAVLNRAEQVPAETRAGYDSYYSRGASDSESA